MSILQKKLNILGDIHIVLSWDGVNYIKGLFLSGEITLVNGKPLEYVYKNEEWTMDSYLRKEGIWSTYDRCVRAILYKDGRIDVTLWKGDTMNGWPADKKWEATFSGLSSFKHFEYSINKRFTSLASQIFDDEEAARVEKRIKQIEEELLNPTK